MQFADEVERIVSRLCHTLEFIANDCLSAEVNGDGLPRGVESAGKSSRPPRQ